jgi:uncharacterized protein (DUF433 family)
MMMLDTNVGKWDNLARPDYPELVHGEASMHWTRITARADQMGGVPCIRGLRIPVATIVGMVAEKMTRDEILDAYPDLVGEDIDETLSFAATHSSRN